jgi:medium-chain acyl-[acyl-carrier-protein] hydrolase
MGGCGAKAVVNNVKAGCADHHHASRVDRGVAAVQHGIHACVECKKHLVADICTSCCKRSTIPTTALKPLPPMREETARKWLVLKGRDEISKKENHYVRNRMICFHWAGGNSNVFKTWEFKDTEIVMVELPGRNARFNEKPMTDLVLIARKIAQALDVAGYLRSSIPLIFFGHSFGAMLATNVARILKREKNFSPKYLVVSGAIPLHMREGRPKYTVDNDEDLLQSLVSMGGVTKEMASNRDTMAQFLPALRADYLAVDKYKYSEDEPLTCPILALGGEDDARVPASEMPEWGKFTTGTFSHKIFPGGHFFLKPLQAEVIEHVSSVVFSGQEEHKMKGLLVWDPVSGTMKAH